VRAIQPSVGALCLSLVAALRDPSARADPWPRIAIPAHNALTLRAPPPRPGPGDVPDRARTVVDALNAASDDAALGFFLPLEPFLAIKDMDGARGYHGRLIRAYRRDIARYRALLPAGTRAEFVRFEPSRSCTWMRVGREANRLPYWSCYGSRLVVRAGAATLSLRVHVMIHWGDRWYVTHLDRFARS
jgi:hypothetical protein